MTNSTTTTNKKPTKRQMFESIKAKYPLTTEEIAFIDHELDLLARKNVTKDGEKKLTDRQKENVAIAERVYDFMEPDVSYTISALLKAVPNLPEDMSNQRLSRIVNNMVDDDRVEKYTEKRVTYFKLK